MSGSNELGRHTRLHDRGDSERYQGLYFHHHEVHALFEELIHKPWRAACWNPSVDIWENEDTFIIEMDLPGVTPEQVQIQARGRTLTVEGQRELSQNASKFASRIHERCEGRFARTFEFDFAVEGKEVQNRHQDGVLTMIVPKSKKE
jgi:HSP20 family molecular chaperone IbpA